MRGTVKAAAVWLCPTEACWKRQVRHALVAQLRGGVERVLFVPLPRQVDFFECPALYVLFGGAAGGSKSKALRQYAYQECLRVNGFRVLLLRRTYGELEQTHLRDAELEAPQFGAQAVPSANLVRFPNGSVMQFGHCQTTADAARYLSAEYDLILFDELVTFEEQQFLLIGSRARTNKPGVVPRVLAGTNPGGPQSHWVRSRFVDKTVDPADFPDYRPEEYAYLPSKLEDNPYLDAGYEKKLLALPLELRRAYRDGDWDIFPGQYFPEWRRARHVTAEHVQYPGEYQRALCMDWGYVKAGYVGWVVQLPEGGAYLEDEYAPVRVSPYEQGLEIARRSKARGLTRVSYLVYDTQMETPQADSGETLIETVVRGMRAGGLSVGLRKADKDRLNGWPRLRAWLRDDPTGTPWLRVSPHCAYAMRTIPAQISDDHTPEDVDSDGEDHAVDALRYWAMSRPAPGAISKAREVKPWSLGWLKAQQNTGTQGVLSR